MSPQVRMEEAGISLKELSSGPVMRWLNAAVELASICGKAANARVFAGGSFKYAHEPLHAATASASD